MPQSATLVFLLHATPTTEIYTLSLHDALPICGLRQVPLRGGDRRAGAAAGLGGRAVASQPSGAGGDRKSTRLNSSHPSISYAVFCLKKKKLIVWCVCCVRLGR